jgi:hypothetical protein
MSKNKRNFSRDGVSEFDSHAKHDDEIIDDFNLTCLNDANKLLKHYNKWRRGTIDVLNMSPTEIGKTIDYITDFIDKNSEKLRQDFE